MPSNEHYTRRIPPQHRRPKFRRWLESNLQPLHDAELLVKSFDEAFGLDKSKGIQMETTGAIVGRSRVLSFDPECGASPVLTDDLYRLLQRAKISLNHWDGTIPGVLKLWENLFPMYELVIRDNQDMTMDLYVIGNLSRLESELMIRGYIAPKPMGVLVRFCFVFIDDELFKQMYIGGAAVQRIAETTLANTVHRFRRIQFTGGAAVQRIAQTTLKPPEIGVFRQKRYIAGAFFSCMTTHLVEARSPPEPDQP